MFKSDQIFELHTRVDDSWILDYMKRQKIGSKENKYKPVSPYTYELTEIKDQSPKPNKKEKKVIQEIPVGKLLMMKSYRYNMWGVYLMVEKNTYYEFIFQKDHPQNKENLVRKNVSEVKKSNFPYCFDYYLV